MNRLLTLSRHSVVIHSALIRSFSVAGAENAIASAAAVKKLRELSGAPLMDCKQALLHETVQGDLNKAIDWLRVKGIAKATKGNRETKEGLIGIYSDPHQITLVEVNCETDFVALNHDFQRFVATVSESVHHHSKNQKKGSSIVYSSSDILSLRPVHQLTDSIIIPAANSSTSPSSDQKEYPNLQEKLGDIISSIRENIVIKRAKTISISPSSEGKQGILSSYLHGKVASIASSNAIQLGKAAGVLNFEVDNYRNAALPFQSFQEQFTSSVAKKLAMHLVASKPLFLSKSQVSSEFLESEKAIFREQLSDADKKKPKDIQDRILQGKLNKRLSEVCLLDQAHVAEEGNPQVQKFLQSYASSQQCAIEITNYELWTLKN